MNIVNGCAPQVGLHESAKKEFWEQIDQSIHEIDNNDKIFMEEDLNDHIKKR